MGGVRGMWGHGRCGGDVGTRDVRTWWEMGMWGQMGGLGDMGGSGGARVGREDTEGRSDTGVLTCGDMGGRGGGPGDMGAWRDLGGPWGLVGHRGAVRGDEDVGGDGEVEVMVTWWGRITTPGQGLHGDTAVGNRGPWGGSGGAEGAQSPR